ncbi:MAG: hypothetical protein KAU23_03720, partial [Anaerolineales bacterium]|nr:hypothetical protein [Anaerolineales bacterium]
GYLNFQATLDGCGFSVNQAEGHGGGIYADHGGAVRVSKTTFDSNTAYILGGGIYQKEGDLFITNSTLSGNVARMGGGIRLAGSASAGYVLDINHTTIAFNTATDNSTSGASGGGGINITGGNANINNSLVILNFSKDCSLVSKQFISGADNVDSYDTCGFNQFFGLTVPLIGSLSGNTHPILPGSPLIDLLSNCGEPDDQRGVPRPQGTACEPGSYEFDPNDPPPPPVPDDPPDDPPDDSSTNCEPFENMDISVVLLSVPADTLVLPLYLKIPGGVPGMEGSELWDYRALLGEIESYKCGLQGFPDRLYCMFNLPPGVLGLALDLKLFIGNCEDPAYYQPKVTIPLPQCHADLGETACEAAGGTWKRPVT